jgi:trimeric autotransporter adhesin
LDLKRSRWVALTLAGFALVLLGSCGGGTSTPFNATPAITGLFPSNITVGSQAFTLFVSGTGFMSDSKGVTFAFWNGSPRSTTFNITTGELEVQIFQSDVAVAPGNTIQITVENPPPGGGLSTINLASLFTITPSQNGLAITSLAPTSKAAGGAAFTLTVNGSGFATNDVVTWNGSPRTTAIAPMVPTVAMAQITADDISTAGSASVAVATPNEVTATPSVNFTITGQNNPMPTVSTLSPSSATHGGGDFQLRVNGSGFAPNAFVLFNGTFHATAFVSSSQLVALIQAADIATMGTATVAVTNPAPGGGTSPNQMFTIN